MKQRAYIGLGANEGEVLETLQAALDGIGSLQDSELIAVSPLYRTAPVEAEGEDFTNAVAALDTALEPYDLLLSLLDLEMRLGRRRRGADAQLKAARKVDLDLLMLGEVQMLATPLTLPHPRMHERAFVLQPLIDIAPDLRIPGRGAAAEWLAKASGQRIERRPETLRR